MRQSLSWGSASPPTSSLPVPWVIPGPTQCDLLFPQSPWVSWDKWQALGAEVRGVAQRQECLSCKQSERKSCLQRGRAVMIPFAGPGALEIRFFLIKKWIHMSLLPFSISLFKFIHTQRKQHTLISLLDPTSSNVSSCLKPPPFYLVSFSFPWEQDLAPLPCTFTAQCQCHSYHAFHTVWRLMVSVWLEHQMVDTSKRSGMLPCTGT